MNLHFDTKFFQKKKFDKRTILKYFRNALEDFQIASNDNRPAVIFNFSYSALIKIGITLIAAQGYRIKSRKGHHIKILEKLSEILDDKNIEIIGDRMRKKRNLDLYEGGIIIETREAKQYLNFVEGTLNKAREYLKTQKFLK
jgi:hypothetical protein